MKLIELVMLILIALAFDTHGCEINFFNKEIVLNKHEKKMQSQENHSFSNVHTYKHHEHYLLKRLKLSSRKYA